MMRVQNFQSFNLSTWPKRIYYPLANPHAIES